jgi:hypothetical protein
MELKTVTKNDSEAPEEPLFIDLEELLNGKRKKPIPTIVSAIEQNGIYAIDRFGRAQKISPSEPNPPKILQAIDLLGSVQDYRNDPWKTPGVDQHPLDAADGPGNPYWSFGWPESDLPDFEAIADQQINRLSPVEQRRAKLLTIVDSLRKSTPGMTKRQAFEKLEGKEWGSEHNVKRIYYAKKSK